MTMASLISAVFAISFFSSSFCMPPSMFVLKTLKIDCKKAKKEAKAKRKKMNKADWPPTSI